MKCTNCGSLQVRCHNSRSKAGTIYRRRTCLDCGTRFSTVEIALDEIQIIQNKLKKYERLKTRIKNMINEEEEP